MTAWRLARCRRHEKAPLDAYLREGWEPFAVSNIDLETIWLRRAAKPAEAGVDDAPRRPLGEPEVAGR